MDRVEPRHLGPVRNESQSLDRVVKLTVFVVDHDLAKLGVLTETVKSLFADKLPTQTLVPVPKLAIDPMLFEVEAVVLLD